MGKRQVEIMQLITPDGVTYDLTSNSKKGNWVLEASGFGMPDIDYITQQGPFQHGVSVRDYRLQPRTIQLSLRQIACDRDEYWEKRTELLNALRPNRDPVGLSGAWVARSKYDWEEETAFWSLCVFNNELYLGSVGDGLLGKWDGAYQVIKVADKLNNQDNINDLVVYDDGGGTDELYGCTGRQGRLFLWNGTDAWTQVCAQLGAEIDIYCMVVFDDGVIAGDNIFAGTSPNGNLYYYNVGGGAWGQACAQLGAETAIYDLVVYDDGTGSGDRLYGGTSPNGMLYRYNPAGGPPGTWVQVCAQLGAETAIYSLCIYNGELYGGTGPNGKLYHYDVTGGAWEEVAAQYGVCQYIYSLVVYHGRLYGTTNISGLLLVWNGEDAWELAAGQYSDQVAVHALTVFNNRLFGGSDAEATLLEYIRRAGQTTLPCATLRRILSDGSIRDLCVHIDKGPEFTSNKQGWDEHSIQEVIRLWAPDPVLYDPTQQIMGTYPVEAVTEYLIDENGDFILDENNDYIELEGAVAFSGAVNECWSIYYEGTWEDHPSFVITGPITNPVIRNDSTDEYIELDYEIEDGRTVTITLTPGNQTIVDDLGVNLIGSVTPESNLQSFHLGPDPEVDGGVNEICLTGTDADANTEFTIAFYNRYIGI